MYDFDENKAVHINGNVVAKALGKDPRTTFAIAMATLNARNGIGIQSFSGIFQNFLR
jgi:hypothetical protein